MVQAQNGLVHTSTTARRGDAAGFVLERGNEGLICEYGTTGDGSGIFLGRDYAIIWSPGDRCNDGCSSPNDNRILRFYEEDLMDNYNDPIHVEIGCINSNGAYVQSDSTRKRDICKLKSSLQKVNAVSGYNYRYKKHQSKDSLGNVEMRGSDQLLCGFLGQELQEVFPEVVEIDEHGNHFVNYASMVPYLVEAIKEQQVQVNVLRRKVSKIDPTSDNRRKADAPRTKRKGTSHKLYQNAPNPFQERSVIKCELAGEVSSRL